jgi:hypothetical protein
MPCLEVTLTAEQEAEAAQLKDILKARAALQIKYAARLLAARKEQSLA